MVMGFKKHSLIGLCGGLLFLGACANTPERSRGDIVMLTNSYARQPEISARLEPDEEKDAPYTRQSQWWRIYEDEDLNALMKEALARNPDILQTRKRLEQAAALARREFSDLLPDLSVSGERATTRGDNKTPSDFSLAGAAGYELDIWGGNRANYKASDLEAQASAEDLNAAAITLSSSIVENWLRLVALREEESLLNEQIKTNEMVLDLQHKRYANGAAEALDVLQQREVLARAKTQLPDIQAAQEIVLHQLSVLAGRTPSIPLQVSRAVLPETVPVPDTGVPAQLLENRPDITAAWLRLLSADWTAEAARIERLPNLDLSASHTTTATKLAGLMDVWLLNLAAGLAAPLIDGGERRAEHARQRALADEKLQAYKEIVLNAMAEVEDALSENHHQARKISAVKEQLMASRNALEQAQISYINGGDSYLSVLNGLINVQSLEQQLVQERRNLALDRVSLYRAVGLGGWGKENHHG